MNPKEPDPEVKARLIRARNELQDVMARHDLGGAILIATHGVAHSVIVLDPTWSSASYNNKDDTMTMNIPGRDDPDFEEKIAKVRLTASLVLTIASGCADIMEKSQKIAKAIGAIIPISHRDWLVDSRDRYKPK